MKKLKSYFAFTTLSFRIVGMLLIPLTLGILFLGTLYAEARHSDGFTVYLVARQMGMWCYFTVYLVVSDYWVLGGCFSDKGRNLRYFGTSQKGREILGNIAFSDLFIRFLYCMIYAAAMAKISGRAGDVLNGLSMYCIVAGTRHGSRHVDGLRLGLVIAMAAQLAFVVVCILNVVFLYGIGIDPRIAILCLTVFYSGLALWVSRLMIRRVKACV